MAKDNGRDLEDPSLLDDDNDENRDTDLASDDAVHGDADPKDKGAPPAGDDDLEIVIEHETEADVEARNNREDAALDTETRDDDSLTDASRSVRERIERERRIAREANARAQAAHQARVAAEAKSRAVQKEALEVTANSLDLLIANTRAALVKAKDDGKTEDEVKLQEDLERLNRRKDTLAQAKLDLEQQEETAKRGVTAAPNPLAEQWMARNKWFNDPRFKEQTGHTALIDRALAAEGYDKNTPEYFQELDRRVRRRLPELQRYMQRPQARPDGGKPRRDPTGGVRRDNGGGAQPGPGGKRRVTLNSADFSNMRAFGLDPNNKEHQREYAMNKIGSKQ